MLQRVLAAIRAHYGLTVFFLYVGAFGIAFIGTVTLPLLAIGMVLLSILLLVPAVLVGDLIGALSRWATRPYLRRGVCPRCREQQGPAWEPPVYRCGFCKAAYDHDGDPYEERPAFLLGGHGPDAATAAGTAGAGGGDAGATGGDAR